MPQTRDRVPSRTRRRDGDTERVALAEKHSKELEGELKRVRKERDKAQNAYRKASIRNEKKTQEKRSAVQTVKDSLTTKLADKLAAAMTPRGLLAASAQHPDRGYVGRSQHVPERPA